MRDNQTVKHMVPATPGWLTHHTIGSETMYIPVIAWVTVSEDGRDFIMPVEASTDGVGNIPLGEAGYQGLFFCGTCNNAGGVCFKHDDEYKIDA